MALPGRVMLARLRVRGWLRLESAIHVGGADPGSRGRLAVAVDGLGRPYLAGTGLAGALRSWDPGDPQDSGWGFVTANSSEGRAGRIVVHDGLLCATTRLDDDRVPADPADPVAAEARTGVGIDRYTGAAAPGILSETAVIPAGLLVRLELDVESGPRHIEADRARLARLLNGLHRGLIRFGAAKSRGLGRARLLDHDLSITEESLDSPAGLLDALAGRGRPWHLAELTQRYPTTGRSMLSVEVAWTPAAPVMVKASTDGAAVQTLPLVTRSGDHVRLLLPGSAIKGVLRSHAERIVRTVAGVALPVPAGTVPERAQAFRQQHGALSVVNALFGTPTDNRTGTQGWAAVTAVDDCLSETTVPCQVWDRLYTDTAPDVGGERARLPDDLRDKLASSGFDRVDHVAIDRWTGGAAPGRLYSVLEPHGVTWRPVQLTIDLAQLRARHPRLHDSALALLLVVLRDLAARRVPLGFGTNRGLGDVIVERITIRAPQWPDGVDLAGAIGSDHGQTLRQAWRQHCNELAEGVIT